VFLQLIVFRDIFNGDNIADHVAAIVNREGFDIVDVI